ncbi:hypothetical protein SAMN05444166_5425 [Singulisphaera sp. GP187]|nr:hypothetical protein SAMN05444166_5425 [Singulisphaera sp. GP187]
MVGRGRPPGGSLKLPRERELSLDQELAIMRTPFDEKGSDSQVVVIGVSPFDLG